ncbi:MAG: putative addiction module antidote protein [Acidobacteria bacterium]|nr:putative addiction module antidote protein [Acidobacteriota bacterium]
MSRTRTRRFDAARYLEDESAMAAYLEAALDEGDATVVAAALGDIARAKGMTRIARATGLGRESLYKSLSATGNPELATVLRVVAALGLELRAVPRR